MDRMNRIILGWQDNELKTKGPDRIDMIYRISKSF